MQVRPVTFQDWVEMDTGAMLNSSSVYSTTAETYHFLGFQRSLLRGFRMNGLITMFSGGQKKIHSEGRATSNTIAVKRVRKYTAQNRSSRQYPAIPEANRRNRR